MFSPHLKSLLQILRNIRLTPPLNIPTMYSQCHPHPHILRPLQRLLSINFLQKVRFLESLETKVTETIVSGGIDFGVD